MSKLIWLTLAAFAIGTEAFVVAGILPEIARDFGRSIPITGYLITIFALAYALGSPVMAVVTGSVERKRILLGSLVVFSAANLLAALAPNFLSLAGARILLALSAGTFMPAANAYAALSVEPERRGRAIALVYGGLTVAMVLGAPLGTAVGQIFGWRASFGAVAVLGAIAVIGIVAALPRLAAPPTASLGQRLATAGRREVLAVLALTVLLLGGAFVQFTYIAPYLTQAAGFLPQHVPWVIMAFGIASVAGNMLSGHASDLWDMRRYITTLLVLLALAFAFLSLVTLVGPQGSLERGLVILGILVWGVCGWGVSTAQQARLVRIDAQQAPVLLSLNASAIYLGTALGSALGGLTIASLPASRLGLVAAAMEVAGLVLFLATARQRKAAAPAKASGAGKAAPAPAGALSR